MAKFLIPFLFVLAILPAGGLSGSLQSAELHTESKLTEKQQKHFERFRPQPLEALKK